MNEKDLSLGREQANVQPEVGGNIFAQRLERDDHISESIEELKRFLHGFHQSPRIFGELFVSSFVIRALRGLVLMPVIRLFICE